MVRFKHPIIQKVELIIDEMEIKSERDYPRVMKATGLLVGKIGPFLSVKYHTILVVLKVRASSHPRNRMTLRHACHASPHVWLHVEGRLAPHVARDTWSRKGSLRCLDLYAITKLEDKVLDKHR